MCIVWHCVYYAVVTHFHRRLSIHNYMARKAKKRKIETLPTERASAEPSNVQGNVLKISTVCCHSIQTFV